MRRTVADVCGRFPVAPGWIGVAAPGLPARDGRSIAFMPGRLPGLEGLDWATFLHASCDVPVLNDAQAALVGETWCGAAKGVRNALLLTLGTGVGGAAIVDGRVLHGHLGRAGHLGHVSLDPAGPLDIVNTPGQPRGRDRRLHDRPPQRRPVHEHGRARAAPWPPAIATLG